MARRSITAPAAAVGGGHVEPADHAWQMEGITYLCALLAVAYSCLC